MQWYYENHRDNYLVPVSFCSPGIHQRHCHPHLHYNLELLYVIEGEMNATLYAGETPVTEVRIRPGEALLFNSSTIHETQSDGVVSILSFLPAGSLPSPFRFPLGKTPSKPAKDESGLVRQILLQAAEITQQSGLRNPSAAIDSKHSEPVSELSHARLNALSHAAISLLYPALAESLIDVNTPSHELDLMKYIYENYRNPDLSVKKLCAMFGFTPKALSRSFLDQTGTGVKRYVDTLRIRYARQLLVGTDAGIESVARDVGYDCTRTFYRVFTACTGQTPSEYRKNNRTDS